MSLKRLLSLAAFAVFAAQAAAAHEFKAGALEIEHPWSRATPGGATVAAGYLEIENDGDAADRLVSVASDISARAEIHEMTTKDGVMTMRPVPAGVDVPAKGEAKLAPGGYHVMFFELKHGLKKGDSFPATLTFEKAGPVQVTFAVEALGATAPDHGPGHGDDHMDHSGMDMDHSKMKPQQ